MNDDELMHYGVLGMKCGHRIAQKKGNTYTYKSHTTKKYEKKSNKALKKYKAYDKRAKRSAKLDSMEQKQSLSVSTKKTIGARAVASILSTVTMGPVAGISSLAGVYSKSYQRYRALGDSEVRAIVKSASFNYPMSMLTKANYIRGKGKYASK